MLTFQLLGVSCRANIGNLQSTNNPRYVARDEVEHYPGGGSTPLYGLNGDVRPDRVWFSEGFVLNGVSISSIFVLNRVTLHDLMYSLTYRNLTTSRIFTGLPMHSVLKKARKPGMMLG